MPALTALQHSTLVGRKLKPTQKGTAYVKLLFKNLDLNHVTDSVWGPTTIKNPKTRPSIRTLYHFIQSSPFYEVIQHRDYSSGTARSRASCATNGCTEKDLTKKSPNENPRRDQHPTNSSTPTTKKPITHIAMIPQGQALYQHYT